MTAPPQRPAVAFKPGDRVRIVGPYRTGELGVHYATVNGMPIVRLDDDDMHRPFGADAVELAAPPPAAADDGLREACVRFMGAIVYDGERKAWVATEGDIDALEKAVRSTPSDATHLAENEALKAENARLEAERDEAYEQSAAHEKKWENLCKRTTCACSYDRPFDVCAYHSPALTEAKSECERLTSNLQNMQTALASAIEALKAFVPAFDARPSIIDERPEYDDETIDSEPASEYITYGDLRRAASTLAAIKGETT